VPFINAGHLTDDGIDMESMNFIPRGKFELLRQGKIHEGDILFCLRGSLGKYAVVEGIEEGAIASSLVIVRPEARVINRFLAAYSGSDLCTKMVRQYANGAAQPNLSARSLGKFQFPLPPLPEHLPLPTNVMWKKR
jgi:type I restriction enzyme S subunit